MAHSNLTLAEALASADALSAGQCAPAIVALVIVGYRLVSGRWPKTTVTFAAPLAFVASGLAWMFTAMALGANLGAVATATSYTGGSVIGAAVYAALLILAAIVETVANRWRHDLLGNRRRGRHGRLTERGSL